MGVRFGGGGQGGCERRIEISNFLRKFKKKKSGGGGGEGSVGWGTGLGWWGVQGGCERNVGGMWEWGM